LFFNLAFVVFEEMKLKGKIADAIIKTKHENKYIPSLIKLKALKKRRSIKKVPIIIPKKFCNPPCNFTAIRTIFYFSSNNSFKAIFCEGFLEKEIKIISFQFSKVNVIKDTFAIINKVVMRNNNFK
jgi:hypothetical protein